MKKLVCCLFLLATPASAQLPLSSVTVGWDTAAGATGYRLTVDGVVQDVGLPPINPACNCPAVTLPIVPAMAHILTVSAYNTAGESAASTPLPLPVTCAIGRPLSECWSTSPVSTLWANVDVGFVNPAGKAAVGPLGTMTLQAGGLALGGTLDGFTFVSSASNANGAISTRVVVMGMGKAGLDWREDTTAIARHVGLTVTPAGVVNLISRSSRSGSTRIVASASVSFPVYLRLTRGTGNMFTGTYSTNGTTWTNVGSTVLALPVGTRVGLFTLAGSSTVASTTQFDSITKVP